VEKLELKLKSKVDLDVFNEENRHISTQLANVSIVSSGSQGDPDKQQRDLLHQQKLYRQM
jgi:hypothetical protein